MFMDTKNDHDYTREIVEVYENFVDGETRYLFECDKELENYCVKNKDWIMKRI